MRREPAGPYDFSLRKLWWLASFSLASVRRHRALFLSVTIATVAAAGAALAVTPRTYEVRCRLLVRPVTALGVGLDARPDGPARTAARLLRADDTLEQLVRDTGAVGEWRMRRPAVSRWKDTLLGRGSAGDEEMVGALAGLLDDRLSITSAPDGTVQIVLLWPDPVMAHRLVDAAQQQFVETWHALEVSSIAEALAILERYAARMRTDLDRRLEAMGREPYAAGRFEPPDPLEAPEDEVRLPDARRSQPTRIERADEERAAPGAVPRSAPAVLDVDERLRLEALRYGPPLEAARERDEEGAEPLGLPERDDPWGGDGPSAKGRWAALAGELESAAATAARAEVGLAARSYSALLDRIEAARLQLDNSSAAFRERYIVVRPPEVPRAPVRPTALLVLVAALADGLALALFATTALDLRRAVAPPAARGGAP